MKQDEKYCFKTWMSVLQLCPVHVPTIQQLIVYTGFSNASMPSTCHSLAKCLSLNRWKSAPFDRANQHFWIRRTSRAAFTLTSTSTLRAAQRWTFTRSPALQGIHAHTITQAHTFNADRVQALSGSESSLEFDMRLKGAMSFQLSKSARQSTHLPPLPM